MGWSLILKGHDLTLFSHVPAQNWSKKVKKKKRREVKSIQIHNDSNGKRIKDTARSVRYTAHPYNAINILNQAWWRGSAMRQPDMSF